MMQGDSYELERETDLIPADAQHWTLVTIHCLPLGLTICPNFIDTNLGIISERAAKRTEKTRTLLSQLPAAR